MALNLQLALREGALFVGLLALGSGLASLLPFVPGLSRLAVAPALGLSAGSSLLAALSFAVPLEHALWFAILPLALVSVVIALRRARPAELQRPPLGTLV